MTETEVRSYPVVITEGCLAGIVVACLEEPNRETAGFIIGKIDSSFLGLRFQEREEALFVISAPQVRKAEADSHSWSPEDLRAYKRIQESIGVMGFKVAGQYHSHPKGSPEISEGNVEFALDATEDLKRNGINMSMESWLEIVVSVNKAKRRFMNIVFGYRI